jgi:hypothetical protein
MLSSGMEQGLNESYAALDRVLAETRQKGSKSSQGSEGAEVPERFRRFHIMQRNR